jgi:hypothetical protein
MMKATAFPSSAENVKCKIINVKVLNSPVTKL